MTQHLIKKYPNRRLYDTKTSKYITLSDLKDLIVSGSTIKVVDSTTDEDLTRAILMQIIMETESSDEPLFNSAMLQQIIRFYGSAMQGMLAKYLEESLQLFMRQQDEIRESFGSDPMSAMTRMAERNMQIWQEFQSNLFGGVTGTRGKKDDE